MGKGETEFDKFDAGVWKILSVSREELKRREEQWKRELEKKKQVHRKENK